MSRVTLYHQLHRLTQVDAQRRLPPSGQLVKELSSFLNIRIRHPSCAITIDSNDTRYFIICIPPPP